jgi:hypothetical protein
MPEDLRERLRNRSERQFQPTDRIDSNETQYNRQPFPRSPAGSSTRGYAAAQAKQDFYEQGERLFSTPQRPITSVQPPPMTPLSSPDSMKVNETRRRRRYDSRAILDLDRGRQDKVYDDKTANFTESNKQARGAKPLHEADTPQSTRYAAVPIDWSTAADDQQVNRWPAKESNRSLEWRVR